ncbi:hypothetical protein MC885_012298 [Smutsia gigantea]|nr:hypothetical protein MC885_012298 [Smutsia gigantea]
MTAVPKPPILALAPPASGSCKQGSPGPGATAACGQAPGTSKGQEFSGAHPGGQLWGVKM